MNKFLKYIAYAIIFAACQSQVMAKEPYMKCTNNGEKKHCNKHICKDHGGWAGIITVGKTPPFGVTTAERQKAEACHRKGKKYVCVCNK